MAPYQYLCVMCITSDVFLWHKRPLDDETLHRKFAIFFETSKQIHTKLLKMWPYAEFDSVILQILYNSPFGSYESRILHMLNTFEGYGLSQWSEPVIDVLWMISYPILLLIDPSYNKYFENGILKDWRKVLENNPQSNYKPKTERIPFDQ